MANKTLVDILRDIVGSNGDITTASDGVYYDLIKRPDVKVGDVLSNGITVDGGLLKAIEDARVEVNSIKDTMYGNDPINGSTGTTVEHINQAKADIDAKSENVDTKNIDFNTKYADFTSGDVNNPAKYETFETNYEVITPHLDQSANPGSIVAVSRDLQGKEVDGTDKTGVMVNKSYVNEVARNLVKGSASEVLSIGSDLADPNSNLSTIAGLTDKIDTIGTDLQLGTNNSSISRVSNNITEVNRVGSDLLNNDTSYVKKVSGKIVAVAAVGEDLLLTSNSTIRATADKIDKVVSVGTDLQLNSNSGIARVSSDLAKVVDVADNKVNIDAVKGKLTEIQQVATNITSATSSVNKVAQDLQSSVSNIDSVATDLQLGANSSINKVSDKLIDVSLVKDALTPIEIVSNDIANSYSYVEDNGSITSPIESRTTGSSSINVVAENMPSISTVIANMTDINNAATNAQSASTSKNKALEWSESASEVEPGKYSAKHWAQAAENALTSGLLSDDIPSESKTYTSSRISSITTSTLDGVMALSESSAKCVQSSKIEPLVTGYTDIPFNVIDDSDNINSLVVNSAANTFTMKRASSYFYMFSLRLQSHTSISRNMTVKLVDKTTGSTITSYTKVVSAPTEAYKVYDFALHVDNLVETTCKLVLYMDGTGYDMESFELSIAGSSTTNVDDIIATKVATSDIVDILTSTDTNKPLSANQGNVLKGLIDSINTLLISDDINLNEMQELVTYIKANRSTLNSLSISNISGLQTALDNIDCGSIA